MRTSDRCHTWWSTHSVAPDNPGLHHLCRERGPHLLHVCACGATKNADPEPEPAPAEMSAAWLFRMTDPAHRSQLRQEVDEEWNLIRAWCDLP